MFCSSFVNNCLIDKWHANISLTLHLLPWQFIFRRRPTRSVAQRWNVSLWRRAFAVLRSTYSWRVTTYAGKPSAIGQPTRPTQPFILSGSINKLQLVVVTTVRGGAIWWTWTKAKGRHCVVCRLNCVIRVWAPWGRDTTCHLGRYINPRTFTFLHVYMATQT